MKKTILSFLIIGLILLSLTGCGTNKEENNSDAVKFKDAYEAINGVANSSGKQHRTLSISEDNPFVYATGKEIVEKMGCKYVEHLDEFWGECDFITIHTPKTKETTGLINVFNTTDLIQRI